MIAEVKEFITAMTPGAYGIWGILFWLLGWSLKGWHESRKLSLQERQDDRQGYGDLIQALQKDNADLRARMESLETRAEAYKRAAEVSAGQMQHALTYITSEIEREHPGSDLARRARALAEASAPIKTAFPVDFTTPPDLLSKLDDVGKVLE